MKTLSFLSNSQIFRGKFIYQADKAANQAAEALDKGAEQISVTAEAATESAKSLTETSLSVLRTTGSPRETATADFQKFLAKAQSLDGKTFKTAEGFITLSVPKKGFLKKNPNRIQIISQSKNGFPSHGDSKLVFKLKKNKLIVDRYVLSQSTFTDVDRKTSTFYGQQGAFGRNDNFLGFQAGGGARINETNSLHWTAAGGRTKKKLKDPSTATYLRNTLGKYF